MQGKFICAIATAAGAVLGIGIPMFLFVIFVWGFQKEDWGQMLTSQMA
jgi:F0F1-type ATP synthase assembly protein I